MARGERPKGRKLGWALVGLGKLSTEQLAPAFAETSDAKLVAIVTGTPEKAADWQEQHQIPDDSVYNYETFDEIASNPAVDVVYIVLPNSMHAEFTIRAAKAGKHVFCEKPMATSVAECQQMVRACDEAGVRLGVGYRCQFEPHHQEAIRFVQEEVFGKARHIDAALGFTIGDPDQWRLKKQLAGGGALMDVGVYALQACRYLSGEEPVSVIAQESKTDPVKFAEVDETVLWTMKFPSGIIASCATTYGFSGLNHIRAYAQDGRFGLDNAFGYSGQKGWTSDDSVPLTFPKLNHFAAEMDAFSVAVKSKAEFGPDGHDGLADLRVIEAIYESIREGAEIKI